MLSEQVNESVSKSGRLTGRVCCEWERCVSTTMKKAD